MQLEEIWYAGQTEARKSGHTTMLKQVFRNLFFSSSILTTSLEQDRVTDHRIGLSLMNLTSVMEGDGLQIFVDAVKKHHEESIMEEMLDIE